MASILILRFKILTPLFLGGADQRPELRAPSFKGALRFWYRTIDTDFPLSEERFFGGVSENAGQSPFLLRIVPAKLTEVSWAEVDSRRFSQGRGRDTRNGLIYLGFPFGMRDGARGALAPSQEFELRCTIIREEDNPAFRQALLASWWLLGHLGGVGSRSRRGFGSLALTDWRIEAEQGDWPERQRLPLLAHQGSPDAWRSAFQQALGVLQREWFHPFTEHTSHPHIGPAFSWHLTREGFTATRWAEALDALGRRLQDFRQRRQPDYDDVKAHLQAAARQGGEPLRNAPSRASFGLPLTFRYSSMRGSVSFAPYDDELKTTLERQGSLLFLRLTAMGERVHPLYLRLDGDVPGVHSKSKVAVYRQGRELGPAKENALDAFMAELRRET